MKKTFTLWAACALPMISSLGAQEVAEGLAEVRKDRERLFDLVLKLETDFGKTLQDYTKLQKNYAELLNRPVTPDQSGKIADLQKQLTKVSAELKARKVDANSRRLLEQDLVNLRNELHRERQSLLVAKARLLRVQQLEAKNLTLQKSLEKETSDRAVTLEQLKSLQSEREAMLVQLKDVMAAFEESKKSHQKASARVAELEKETSRLKMQLRDQDVELRKLRADQTQSERALATAAGIKKERDRLSTLLVTREKELDGLRGDLATEMKRSLDVPLLIKVRDELQDKLEASESSAGGLKKQIIVAQEMMSAMKAKLAKNEEAMAKLAKLDDENKILLEEQEQLRSTIQMAKGELVRSRGVLQKTEAMLHESQKKAALADEAQKKNSELLKQLDQLRVDFAKAAADVASMQKKLTQNEAALKEAAETRKELTSLQTEREQLTQKMKKAQAASRKVDSELKAARTQLAQSQEMATRAAEVKKQHDQLLDQHQKVKEDFAKARTDLGAMQSKLAQNEAALKVATKAGEGMTALKAERDDLSQKLQSSQAAYQDFEAKLKVANTKLAKSDQMVATAKKALSEADQLRETLNSSQAALKQVEVSAVALRTEKEALAKDISERDAALKRLRAEMAKRPDLSEKVAELQKQKEQLAANLAKREEDLKQTRGDLGRLQLAASVAKKQFVALKRQTAVIDPVRYAKGEADVTAQQARVLGQVQSVLKLFPQAQFEIVGHTCDLGSAEGNLRLSQERAKALHDFLLEKGIAKDRLKSRGVGQNEPAVPNTSEANRRQNRRVVVEILD